LVLPRTHFTNTYTHIHSRISDLFIFIRFFFCALPPRRPLRRRREKKRCAFFVLIHRSLVFYSICCSRWAHNFFFTVIHSDSTWLVVCPGLSNFTHQAAKISGRKHTALLTVQWMNEMDNDSKCDRRPHFYLGWC
jgi:hypothetical protein